MRRWRDGLARLGVRGPVGRDAFMAAVLVVLGLGRIGLGLALAGPGTVPASVLVANLLSIADLATIGLRRRAPRVALGLATAIVLCAAALPTRVVTGISVFVCAYTVAVLLPRRAATTALGACAAVHAVAGVAAVSAGRDLLGLPTFWSSTEREVVGVVLATAATYGIGGLLGAYVQTRRAYTAELVARAEQQARIAVVSERGRIARELHDIAAHDLSAIVVQAGAAGRLVDRDPAAAKSALQAIRAQGRETLTALRQLVGIMRDSDSDGRAPQPTLLRLDSLVAGARGAGMTVELTTVGSPQPLPAAVDLTAYRVVQEALTNAHRHAPGAAVSVTVAYDRGVRVLVRNAAPAAPAPPGDGHGLLGMRERVQQHGGALRTGPTPDGGWQVDALLPAGER